MGCISRVNLCPASGDTENVLLQKILQSLNEGGGGSGGGVTGLSVNGGPFQTGQVSIVTGGGGGVSSVNGDPGPAVLLDSGEIPEGSNLYFTNARAIASTLTGFVSGAGTITAASTILQAVNILDARTSTGGSGPFVLKAGDTMTGALLLTTGANVSPLQVTSYSATGASAPFAFFASGSWNTTGAPTAFHLNVTDTASAAASILFDYQLSSVSVLNLRKDGRLTLAGRAAFNTTSGIGHALATTDANNVSSPTVFTLQHVLSAGTAGVGMGITFDYNIDSTTTVNTRAARWITAWTDATHATRSAQTIFQSFDAGVEVINVILGNGQVQGNPGTVADPSFTNRNDQDTGIYFPAANTIGFTAGGVAQATLTGNHFNTLGGTVSAALGNFTTLDTTDILFNGGDFEIFSPSAGSLILGDGALGLPVAIAFGGATLSASFPSLRFSGTEIQFKLADNSAFSNVRLNHLFLANGTAPGGDPTTSAEQWAASGEWQYRTSGASEGSGQTNRVHNRTETGLGVGTNYTLTTSYARVDFGTTDPEVTLPTAGTYLLLASVLFTADAAAVTDLHGAIFRNSTDSVFVGGGQAVTLGASFFGSVAFSHVVTITASKTIQLWAANFSAARGVVVSTSTSVKYVRLF